MRLHLDHIASRRALAVGVAVGLITIGISPMAAQAATTCELTTANWGPGIPVNIDSANELYCIGEGSIRENVSTLELNYVVTDDIGLANFIVDMPWRPIGSSEAPFTGSFNGGDFKITGLDVTQAQATRLGLFGVISGASISNVTLATPKVTGGDFVGSLVGEAIDSSITGVTATSVDIEAHSVEATVGGLIGSMTNSDVSDVTVAGNVEAVADQTMDDDEGVGGVIGRIWDGDIAGREDVELTEVNDVSFSGSVSGPSLVGGVIGHADTDPSGEGKYLRLINIRSAGSVTSTVDYSEARYPWGIGGVIGMIFDADISDIRSTSTVTSKAPSTGGLIGRLFDSNLRDAHASGNVSVNVNPEGDLTGETECSVGGLIGLSAGARTSVTRVEATGDVSCMNGSFAGGLIGMADNTDVTSAQASGNVSLSSNLAPTLPCIGRSYLGGLLGVVWSGSIVSDVVSTGTVTGIRSTDDDSASSQSFYGGLVGYLGSGVSLVRAYTTSTLTTDVNPENPTIGSIIGVSEGTLTGLSFTSTDQSTLQSVGTAEADRDNMQYRSLSDLGKYSTYRSWNSPDNIVITDEWVPSPTTQVWGTCATVAAGLPFLQWQRTEPCPAVPTPPSPSPDQGGGNTSGDAGASSAATQPATATASSGAPGSQPVSSGVNLEPTSTYRQPTVAERVTGSVTLVPESIAATTVTRTMRQEASSRIGSAPTVMATVNQPVKLLVPGFTPGATYTVKFKSKTGYVVLGSVRADASGRLQIPVFRMTEQTALTIAVVSQAGSPSYVKVSAAKGSGAGETRKRPRGNLATTRR